MCYELGWGMRKSWDHDGFLTPMSVAFFTLAFACPSLCFSLALARSVSLHHLAEVHTCH